MLRWFYFQVRIRRSSVLIGKTCFLQHGQIWSVTACFNGLPAASLDLVLRAISPFNTYADAPPPSSVSHRQRVSRSIYVATKACYSYTATMFTNHAPINKGLVYFDKNPRLKETHLLWRKRLIYFDNNPWLKETHLLWQEPTAERDSSTLTKETHLLWQ